LLILWPPIYIYIYIWKAHIILFLAAKDSNSWPTLTSPPGHLITPFNDLRFLIMALLITIIFCYVILLKNDSPSLILIKEFFFFLIQKTSHLSVIYCICYYFSLCSTAYLSPAQPPYHPATWAMDQWLFAASSNRWYIYNCNFALLITKKIRARLVH
jgi:hypothetical protein